MASTHIELGGSRLGGKARSTVDQLHSAFDQMQDLKLIMDSVSAASDWTSLETALGLQAGQGQTVYNLFAGAYAAINVFAVTDMLNKLG